MIGLKLALFHHPNIPQFLYTWPQAIAPFHWWYFGLAGFDQVKSEGFEAATVIVEVNDVGLGVFSQAKVFGKGIGIVGGGAQKAEDIDGDPFLGQLGSPFANIFATFPAGIGTIADQEDTFLTLRIV